jgi:flagellar basal body-associated protein FliL
MSELPPEDDERVSRKVVYEHTATSGSSHSAMITIIVIVVLALALIGYILMHVHK